MKLHMLENPFSSPKGGAKMTLHPST